MYFIKESVISNIVLESDTLFRYIVWYGCDPLMEKYPASSPYVFCAGNPVKYIDPDGRKFMDSSKEYVDKFKKVITDKLASLNNNLNELTSKNKVSAKKIERVQNQINEVNEASKELNALEESDQLYSIQIGIPRAFKKEDTNLYGSTFYNIGTDAVTVGIDVSLDINSDEFIGALAHELKHCFQFEIGELTFSKNGGAGIAYDFNDEVAAHKRGGLFGASRSYPDDLYKNLPTKKLQVTNDNKEYLQKKDNYFRIYNKTYKP